MKQNYINNKVTIKNIHETAKDIKNLYNKETIIPGWIAYIFWFNFFLLFYLWGKLTKC